MGSVAIRNHLSRVMGERRLKIQDVASRSGLAYTTVFTLYHDKARRIDLATLKALCRTLDAQVGDLFEYVPDEDSGRDATSSPSKTGSRRRPS